MRFAAFFAMTNVSDTVGGQRSSHHFASRHLGVFFLLQGEDRGIAARPIWRNQTGARVTMRKRRALAAQDHLTVFRLDRIDRVRERVGRSQCLKQQRPAEVGIIAR